MTAQQLFLLDDHQNMTGSAIQAEQVRLLYAGIPVSLAVNVLIASILVTIQLTGLDVEPIIVWCTLFGATIALRTIFTVKYRHVLLDESTSRILLARFRIGTAGTGIAWGLASYLLFPVNDIPHQTFLAFAIAGMTAGAVTSLSVDLTSSLVFIIPALVPLIGRLLAVGGGIPLAMGAMGTIYLLALILNAKRTYINNRENICLRLEAVTREDELRKSEANLNLAQAIGQIGSWILDISTKRLEWSAEVYRIFDIQPQEAIDQAIFVAATHPNDRDFVMHTWDEAMAGNATFDVEHRIVVGGTTRWVRELARVEYDSEGRPLTGIGTVQDITERKLMEQKILRINEELEERVKERTKELVQSQMETSSMLRRYKTLMLTSKDGIHIMDTQGNLVEVNDAFCHMLGYTREEIFGLKVTDWDAQDSAGQLRKEFKVLIEKAKLFETLHRRKDGTLINVEVSVNGLEIEGLGLLFATSRDITERKQIEEKLRLTQYVTDHVPDCIMWVDEQARICYANEAASRVHGYTNKELLAMKVFDLDPDFPVDGWPVHWQELKQKGNLNIESGHKRKDGSIFPIEVSANYVKFDGKEFNVAFIRDISERKRVEDKIRNLAFHDTLTGLPNRRLLEDRLDQALAASKRGGHYGAVIFLDLDNFKPLNDTHGHKAGDLLLVEVGKRLDCCVREVDTVARFGGDEFVVVLNELAGEESECTAQAKIVAEKIQSALAEPYLLNYNAKGTSQIILHHDVGACMGVVLFNNIANAENILKWADKAMYQAKEAGRNQIRFYDAGT